MNNMDRRNIKILAENAKGKNGFNIYLSFSGSKEYLMFHRHNSYLYEILKDGISVNELSRKARQTITDLVMTEHMGTYRSSNPRLKRRKNLSRNLEKSFQHLLCVVNEYIEYEYEAA